MTFPFAAILKNIRLLVVIIFQVYLFQGLKLVNIKILNFRAVQLEYCLLACMDAIKNSIDLIGPSLKSQNVKITLHTGS